MTKLTMVHPHTREHYSVIKRDKLLLCATTWMNVQRVTLSENSQSQTVLYCIIPFIWHSWNDKNLKEFQESWASLVAQRVKRLPAVPETWVQTLCGEDPLEKEMATHSSSLAWRIPRMEEPGRLQSVRSQRVAHDWAISLLILHDFSKEHNLNDLISSLESLLP